MAVERDKERERRERERACPRARQRVRLHVTVLVPSDVGCGGPEFVKRMESEGFSILMSIIGDEDLLSFKNRRIWLKGQFVMTKVDSTCDRNL